ncbi:MAG: peptidase S41, partial [Bacteroidota bacterium]
MRIYALLLAALTMTVLTAQIQPQWVRYPAISPDGSTIVFTYKGNLFRVPVNGGTATQLTFHKAHDYKAVWNKAGSKIAFASDRYGNFDVFVMDAQGGEAKRLTYHSNDEVPYTFSHEDTEVLFGAVRQDAAQHRQYPTRVQPELYKVSETGGRVDQLLTVPAQDVQVNSDGSLLLYHDLKGYENEFRKHHVSAIARDIWKYLTRNEKKRVANYFEEQIFPVLTPLAIDP